MAEVQITYTLTELCQTTGILQDELVEVVELGVIVPLDPGDSLWVFDAEALMYLQRARRLQNELDLDWHGVAMTLTLLKQVEQLKKENAQLRRRLDRFVLLS
ncbi:chaperone-modulator protein CbpM [Yersinia entomophaga]|uniref:Chaperone-modulator protein CbpM n=1 Tax=Yersinia entomophaga TaxID=935293 RepID=A0ABM6BIV4_YERET|nr:MULTISPECIES: chaperone modulator CbpM [Yersinia]ANI29345.1 chaperone-modulator protein CbpM [Yersinia entomophaga]OWF88326.1 chaperone-modulator protein CbpM [Yersinia entomophaga]